MNDKKMNRRNILKWGLGLTPVLALTPLSKSVAQVCGLTPTQPEGPFYPIKDQADKDTDLTWVQGRNGQALGEVIFVQGVVLDEKCQPVSGAIVEIWQACASGKYDHPGDHENPAPLDPHFQYWGRALTDQKGNYLFKTVIPGAYSAGEGWMRPPHIHFKVHKRGFLELTTQMYFKGQKYNEGDLILQRLGRSEQAQVVIELKEQEGRKVANFTLTLTHA